MSQRRKIAINPTAIFTASGNDSFKDAIPELDYLKDRRDAELHAETYK